MPPDGGTVKDALMTDKVLVAYTSKIAATDEIAQIIGTELAEAGAAEVMLSLPDLDDDLTPLDTMAEVIAAFR